LPELPEVETVARQLDPLVAGQRLAQIRMLDSLLDFSETKAVEGSTIPRVRRIGKEVMFELHRADHSGVTWFLAVHLRMTGRLIHAFNPGRLAERGDKHLRAILELGQGQVLFYDMRRFGTFRLYRSEQEAQPAGDEPLNRSFNARRLKELIRGSEMPAKVWLLRQDRICGIGNIYASEILHDCAISPFRLVSSLDDDELSRLASSTKKILRKAILHCGTTFSDFQNANGEIGGYQKFLRVYQQQGQPCHNCGTEIVRAVQAQRSSFWCPGCQL
jgi:formamidopyrimidine-DNA glycosylase